MFGYFPPVQPQPVDGDAQPALDLKGRLRKIRELIEALPCEKYWGTPGPTHCRRCEALSRLDEELQ